MIFSARLKALVSWECLNTALRESSDSDALIALLEMERRGQNRTSYKVRIAGRINKVMSQKLTAQMKGD